MTPNGVPPVGVTGEQQMKGKRRQRKGSYSNEHNGNGLEKPQITEFSTPSHLLSHPVTTHYTPNHHYQANHNNSSNSAKVLSPNATTLTPQSLNHSLSDDSTFDSSQPVIGHPNGRGANPKSTGSESFRSGGSRQSGKGGATSCLSTLCWYTLVFFVLLIVFGIAFGTGFAVAKYIIIPACDSSSSSSISSSSSSLNPLLQSNSARNYAADTLPHFNSQVARQQGNDSSMLIIPVADNLINITTTRVAPSLKDDVELKTTTPLPTTTFFDSEGRSRSNANEEIDSISNATTPKPREESQVEFDSPNHKADQSANQTVRPTELPTTSSKTESQTNDSNTESKQNILLNSTNSLATETLPTTTEAPSPSSKNVNNKTDLPTMTAFDPFGDPDFNFNEQIDPLLSNTDSIIAELFPSTSPSSTTTARSNDVATTIAPQPATSTQIPSSNSTKFDNTNSSTSNEENPSASSLASSATLSTKPPSSSLSEEPVLIEESTEMPPPINSTLLIDGQQLTFSVQQPSSEQQKVANDNSQQETTTLPSNQFIQTTTNDSIEPSSTTLDAGSTLETDNGTISETNETVTQSEGGDQVERREKSVDLDLDLIRKSLEDNNGNDEDNVELPEVSNLTNNSEEQQPTTTASSTDSPTITETAVTETSTNVSATATSASTSEPLSNDVVERNTTDILSLTNSTSNAQPSSTTETPSNSNSTTDLLSMGSSEANNTDTTNSTDTIDTDDLSATNNRTGNERALEMSNQTSPNSTSSGETDSSNGRLVFSSQKSPESSDLELSGLLSLNNVAEQDITCLDSQFTCPRLPLVSTISPKAKRSIMADVISASVSSKSPLQPHCLPQSFLCNGVVDCPDSFDEMNCGEIKCGQNFMCGAPAQTSPTPFFISNSTTDMMASGSSIVNVTMLPNENSTQAFTNGTNFLSSTMTSASQLPTMCIPRQLYCDGFYDCKDGEDEIECKITKCQANEIRCVDGSACITAKMACDGVYHCKDHSDEKGCVSKSSCESAGRFFCDNGLCIDKVLHCDGKRQDCSDGSDEMNCPTLESCTSLGKFYCHTSHECIDAAMQCDGVHQCSDHSDEDFCFENDLDGVVHVLNSASKVWSILCVPERDFFTTLEADDLCAKMGQERATNYTLIEVSRLLGEHSTWAVVNASVKSASTGAPYVTALTQYSQNITHTSSCPSNLTVSVQCSPYSKCSASNQILDRQQQQQSSLASTNDTEALNASPSVAIEVPEEVVPTPLYISALNGTSVKCMAYAVASNWLVTSGLCLNNFHSTLLKDIHMTNGNGSLSMPVEQIRLHPQYSLFRTIRFPDYDMALVETTQVLDSWTLAHSSICLPAAKLDAEITCFIGALGNQNGDSVAFEVKEASHCNTSQHFNGIITERTFCAERTGSKEPDPCLPPYLPLLCLTSKSQWYLSGFISYQRGCHELTSLPNSEKLPNFRGYFKHPTVFSNFFVMKDFIERTLGTGTYMKSRPKLDPSLQLSSQTDPTHFSSSSPDNSTNFTPLSPSESGQGSQSGSQVGSNPIANHRTAYVRRDEETVALPAEQPPTVTPDSRLQKSLNLSLPEIMKSENISESISKMVELSSGYPEVVQSSAPNSDSSAAALGNGSIAVPVPTDTTITSHNSSVLIPIITTIAPSQLSDQETTTSTVINFAKENNSSTMALLGENKPLVVESHLNETKSETLPELPPLIELMPNDMVIEGSGFSAEQPESNEPVSKNVQQTEMPPLSTPPSNELNSETNPPVGSSQNTQLEETTMSLPEEVTTSLPPELKLDETLKADQFTTMSSSLEKIKTTTDPLFILKENATNLKEDETSNLNTFPTVTTLTPELKENFREKLLDINSTQV